MTLPRLLSFACILSLLLLGCPSSDDSSADESASEGSGDETAEADQAAEEEATTLTLYSGRNEEMIGDIISRYEEESGVDVVVNYGGSAEMAATILEEGDRARADVFLAQDASTLGFLEQQGVLAELPGELTERVSSEYRSSNGRWVGITGRARVLAYNTAELTPDALPANLQELTTEPWRGRVGWAPENASFQSFVATMIALEGEEATREWLTAMQANEPRAYPSNTPMVTAIGRGEIDVGLTNHYYLYRLRAENGDDFPVENHYFRSGDAASFVNVTGAAVLETSENAEAAHAFIEWMLTAENQATIVAETYEFPLVEGAESPIGLPAANSLNNPTLDLGDIDDLATTVQALRQTGALQ